LKEFGESFLTAPILICTADERDRSCKNPMETSIKWFRKYIF
jgi:hypothetical protein